MWKMIDVPGWQKWFGAAVLGFAFALFKNYDFSFSQLQGILFGVSLILCYNQSINDCFDVEIDRLKEERMGKKLIISSVMSLKAALTITFLLLAIGLASAWLASVDLFFVTAFMAFLGTVYSAPPLRLKMKYPFSTLVQFVGCFLPFLAGVSIFFRVDLQSLIMSSVFCFLAMVQRFDHEIYHHRIDRETGKMTVAVTKGIKSAKILRWAFLLVGTVEFVILTFFWLTPLALSALFFVYLFLCVDYSIWFGHLPKTWRKMLMPIIDISGFVLFLIVISIQRILPY